MVYGGGDMRTTGRNRQADGRSYPRSHPRSHTRSLEETFTLIILQREDYEAAISKIKEQGCLVKYPVDIADLSALTVDGKEAVVPIACE
jgi:hypothetical protein